MRACSLPGVTRSELIVAGPSRATGQRQVVTAVAVNRIIRSPQRLRSRTFSDIVVCVCAQEGGVTAAVWAGHGQAMVRQGPAARTFIVGAVDQFVQTSDAHDAASVTSRLGVVPWHGLGTTSARRGSWRQPITVESPSGRQILEDCLVRSRGFVAALAFTFSRRSQWV